MKQGYFAVNELIREFGALIGTELANISSVLTVNNNEIEAKAFIKLAIAQILDDSFKYNIPELLQDLPINYEEAYVTRQKVEFLPFADNIRLFKPYKVTAKNINLKEATLEGLVDGCDTYKYSWNQNGICLFEPLSASVKPDIRVLAFTYSHYYKEDTKNLNQARDLVLGKDFIDDGSEYIAIDAEWLLTALCLVYGKSDVSHSDLLATYAERYQRILQNKLNTTTEFVSFKEV